MTGKRKLQDVASLELKGDTLKKVPAKRYPRRRTAVTVWNMPEARDFPIVCSVKCID